MLGFRNTAVDTVDQEMIYVGDEHGKLLGFRQLIQKVGSLRTIYSYVSSLGFIFVNKNLQSLQNFKLFLIDILCSALVFYCISPNKSKNTAFVQ